MATQGIEILENLLWLAWQAEEVNDSAGILGAELAVSHFKTLLSKDFVSPSEELKGLAGSLIAATLNAPHSQLHASVIWSVCYYYCGFYESSQDMRDRVEWMNKHYPQWDLS